ncbi:hypothetical protein PIB30_008014 [Stylosanthes scabra]|uniref:Fold protein n=1 Tax=Stylosanthes scabra TaxID=79078 RepID=A0ABU6V658_9FABA|nr:hypothetical protein [Stylosanthes scabra]
MEPHSLLSLSLSQKPIIESKNPIITTTLLLLYCTTIITTFLSFFLSFSATHSHSLMSTCHSWLQDLEVEVEEEDGGGLFQHPQNLSRLSVCTTSSSMCGVDEDAIMMSRLSIDDDEGDDADGELSGEEEQHLIHVLSSASDKEDFPCSCSSLPNTPPRAAASRRRKNKVFGVVNEKEYASDNGPREKRRIRNRRSSRRVIMSKSDEDEEGEGSGGRGGDGVVLITRPKGGKRTLCMGLEEVKACRELGFELELPQTPHYTSSSGANSPIANWRISSPGDDPREVKARLKVWAQAVALASASKYAT